MFSKKRWLGVEVTEEGSKNFGKFMDSVGFDGIPLNVDKTKDLKWVTKYGVVRSYLKRGRIQIVECKDGSYVISGINKSELKSIVNNL